MSWRRAGVCCLLFLVLIPAGRIAGPASAGCPPTSPAAADAPWFCGVPIDLRSGALQGQGRPPGLTDSLLDATLNTTHFRIHYATHGETAVYGWPSTAYRDSAAASLERSYRLFLDLGFPSARRRALANGDLDLIDCFLLPLGGEAWGLAVPQENDTTGCPGAACCSGAAFGYLELRNSLPVADWPSYLRSLAAHEYFHLVQMALRANMDAWFQESTAAWAARKACPDDPFYLADLDLWFLTPYLGLWTSGSRRDYGSAHYWSFLEESTDADVVPAVWRRCCALGWRESLTEALRERGLSLDSTLVRFALWNDATAARDDGRHYFEGAKYPPISYQANHALYPVAEAVLPAGLTARAAGSNYILFGGPMSRDTLSVRFEGDPALRDLRRISFVAVGDDGARREWTMAPDDSGDVAFDLPDWPACDDLTMIVTNFDGAAQNREFRYSAWEHGSPVIPEVARLVCLPNPCRGETSIRFDVSGRKALAALSIFDTQGRMIRRLSLGTIRPGEQTIPWDGGNDQGRPAPSGTYLVRVELGTSAAKGRVTLVR